METMTIQVAIMLLLICFDSEPSSIFYAKMVLHEKFMIRIIIKKPLDEVRNDLVMLRNQC